MKLIAKPTRAVFVVGNMDGSLAVDNTTLDYVVDMVKTISNMTPEILDRFYRWFLAQKDGHHTKKVNPLRQAGDTYEVCDDTGDAVALVVLV